MFKDGKKPAFTAPAVRLSKVVMAFLQAGYEEHTGRKMKRAHEVVTLRKRFTVGGARRQCHVQITCPDGKVLEVFAHTEPDMSELQDIRDLKGILEHGLSALTDGASYQAGARMIKRDLRRIGAVLPVRKGSRGGRRVRR